MIPACLWFLARDRKNGRFRDRRGQVLFIDARKLGQLIDRTHRELPNEEVARIARTYHAWRGDKERAYTKMCPVSAKVLTCDEIRKHGHVLTPGRCVGAKKPKMWRAVHEETWVGLTATLKEQFAESARLEDEIEKNLKGLGFEL